MPHGKVSVPAHATLGVANIERDSITVIFGAARQKLPLDSTDILDRIPAIMKAAETRDSILNSAREMSSKQAPTPSPSPANAARGSIPMDILRFGSSDSEKTHSLSVDHAEIIKGGLDQEARQLLPLDPPQGIGGSMTFVMKVDPDKPNYFTVKLWGGDDSLPTTEQMGRLYLYVPKDGKDYQVGYRHEGDYMPLNIATYYTTTPGRFFYSTTLLPEAMTKGKTELLLKIQSTGRIFGYGRGDENSGGNYQFNLKIPTRGIYSAYTHTEAMLAVPADEVQGKNPEVRRISRRGSEILDDHGEFTRNVNHAIEGLLDRESLDLGQIETLAKAYFVPQVQVAYRKSKVLDKVVEAIDAVTVEYNKDPENAPKNWGGKYGPIGWAVALLAEDLNKRLDEKVEIGPGGDPQTRRKAWGDMLFASREYGRLHSLCALTNQTMIASEQVYKANRGLLALGDKRAFPEDRAQGYLKSAAGIEPWLGNDLPEGGHESPYGANYFQVTRKGTTREWGFAGSGYGEVQNYVVNYYKLTGNPVFRDQAAKIALGRAPFRRPTCEQDPDSNKFVRMMQGIGEIGWRGGGTFGDHNIYQFRQPIHTAALTLHPALVGYAKQMIDDDDQFFDHLGPGGVDDLDIWANYKAIKGAPDSKIRLPMTDGQPDFVWADEENQAIAIKHGDERLWLTAYFQAKIGVNRVGRFHYSTPHYDQYGTIVTDPKFTPSGEEGIRSDTNIDTPLYSTYVPPDPPLQAYGGEKLPIAKWPSDAKDRTPFVGRVDFSSVRFGRFLIGMNGSENKTFTLPVDAAFGRAKDLVTGKTLLGTATIPPLSTVVLDLGNGR